MKVQTASTVESDLCDRGCGQPVRWVFATTAMHLPESLCHNCADIRTQGWGSRLGGC